MITRYDCNTGDQWRVPTSAQGYYDCELYIENKISAKENQNNEITRGEL